MPLKITTVDALTTIGDALRVERTQPQTRPDPVDPDGEPETFVEYRLYRLEAITDPVALAETTDTERWVLKGAHETREDAVNAGLALIAEG